jgi:ABC-2 type transport system permease protein
MITRKLFIIITLAFPLLALLAIGIYQVVTDIGRPTVEEEMSFGYIDEAGGFSSFTEQEGISLIPFDTLESATQALIKGDIAEYFVIPADYITTGVINRYTLTRELEIPDRVLRVMNNFLVSNLLHEKITPQVIDRVEAPMQLVSTRLTTTGEVATEQGGPAAFIVPYIFSLLLMISIFFSSGYLLEGLGEEKENRIMEILLSSVSPRQLLAGKVLGLGAGGLIQMLVWLISAPLLINVASATIGGFIGSLQIPPNFIILGIVYFILGYSLFAVLMAGVGAISPTTREAQQLVPIFSLGAVSPFWFLPFIFNNPNHAVARALTIFPITAPVTTMARLGLADIAAWELSLSIAVLAVSAVGGIFVAAKVFRIYLLMYGKRPGVGEVIRSLRNA